MISQGSASAILWILYINVCICANIPPVNDHTHVQAERGQQAVTNIKEADHGELPSKNGAQVKTPASFCQNNKNK